MGDNIKMDLQEVGWGDMDWIALAQDRDMWWALVNVVMNLGFHTVWGDIEWHCVGLRSSPCTCLKGVRRSHDKLQARTSMSQIRLESDAI